VLAAAGIEPAREPLIDFVAKACLVAPLLLFSAVNWAYFTSGWNLESGTSLSGTFTWTLVQRNRDDALRAIVVGVLVTLRLAWLWSAARKARVHEVRTIRRERRRWVVDTAICASAVMVLAASFGIYALWDHRSPSLWLQVSPLTAQDLHYSDGCDHPHACVAVDVRYACDEPCSLRDVWLRESDNSAGNSFPLPAHMQRRGNTGEERVVTRSQRIRDAGDSLDPLPTHETREEAQIFSPRQSDWIRRELGRGRTIEIEAQVDDDAGNSTSYVYDFGLASRLT